MARSGCALILLCADKESNLAELGCAALVESLCARTLLIIFYFVYSGRSKFNFALTSPYDTWFDVVCLLVQGFKQMSLTVMSGKW